MHTTAPVDTDDEYREAFLRHCEARARINPNEPGARIANTRRRTALLDHIDRILDTYLETRTIEPL